MTPVLVGAEELDAHGGVLGQGFSGAVVALRSF